VAVLGRDVVYVKLEEAVEFQLKIQKMHWMQHSNPIFLCFLDHQARTDSAKPGPCERLSGASRKELGSPCAQRPWVEQWQNLNEVFLADRNSERRWCSGQFVRSLLGDSTPRFARQNWTPRISLRPGQSSKAQIGRRGLLNAAREELVLPPKESLVFSG
jgi:hypothetical protein